MAAATTPRPRFFQGQYLGPEDLTAAIDYGRHSLGRHVLGGHTWGIAAGLRLVETTGPGGQTEVAVTPGYAWDGFGRPIVVLISQSLPASLFAPIRHQASDEPDGRPVEVWIGYDETATRNPQPGFEVCEVDDQRSRVQEGFVFVVGDQLSPRPRLVIGGTTADADRPLQGFDPAAPAIFDESVPFQEFPDDKTPRRWLIPIGKVRWKPSPNAAQSGAFKPRSADDKKDSDAFRRYVGVVAESVEAAAGRLRLRKRDDDPNASPFSMPAEDLVWVEGNLDVEGDAKIVGGRLELRDVDGSDHGIPLAVQRAGDPGPQPRALQVVVGVATAPDHRFAVGPQKSANDPTVAEKFVVRADGNVGIGTSNPQVRLEIADVPVTAGGSDLGKDIWVRAGKGGDDGRFWVEYGKQAAPLLVLSDFDDPPRIQFQQSGAKSETDPEFKSWIGQAKGSSADLALQGGNVAVGHEGPSVKLHVVGDRIRVENAGKRLDLRTDGTEVDLQSETNDLYIRASGPGGKNRVVINSKPEDGFVGVGVENPDCKLHVAGDRNASATNIPAHVAVIENRNVGTDADVLALKIGAANAGAGNNFITFFAGNTAIASFEGNSGSVKFNSAGADVAEYLPRLHESEPIEAGDIVGVFAGRISKQTYGASHTAVITGRPIVAGNAPHADRSHLFETVAFVGQVRIKVRGAVRDGDFIVPSGLEDGTGIALSAESLSPVEMLQVVGRAWSSSTEAGVKRVLCAVGLPATSGLSAAVEMLQRQEREIAALQRDLEALAARLE